MIQEEFMSKIPVVLCIDDEASGLQLRQALLERAGYRVYTAPDGRSGLTLLKKHHFDAVVLDYVMPEMNGEQVAEAIHHDRPSLPILLLSSCMSIPERVLDMVDANVTKYDGPKALLQSLARLLTCHRSAKRSPESIHPC
jgi:CheY-like chemotaxis protein